MTAVAAEAAPRYASALDAFRYGEFHPEPVFQTAFTGRFVDVVPGRFHLYGAWSCPASHRLAIIRRLAGLEHDVSMSYVNGQRDARGWAFRESTGPDPVNGFALLREAYTATDAAYTGPVTVPVLWDKHARHITSTDADTIGTDLLAGTDVGVDQDANAMVADEVTSVIPAAAYRADDAAQLRETLNRFDHRLRGREYVAGARLTDADIRLWVALVRYDAGPNAHGLIGPHLDAYPHLWRWAQRLYRRPAFRETTDFAAFTAPFASLPPWTRTV